MRLPPALRSWPRRGLSRRVAVLAAAAVLAALTFATVGAQQALAASPARPAASGTLTAGEPATRAAAAPAPDQRAAPPAPSPAQLTALDAGCGLLDVTCYVTSSITSWFAGLVNSAVNPLLGLIGQTALSTPQPGSVPAVQTLWSTSLAVADACYVLLVLIGGIIVMSHETLQTSYAAKEIAPRIVLGFMAANLSMILMSRAVDLANGLSAAFTADGVNPQTAARSLVSTLGTSITSDGIFLILLELAGVVLALVLAAVYVIRLMAVVLLAAAAPVLLSLYALPQTAWAARWWWRALTAALAIQVVQGLVMTATVRVFFSPGWLPWHVTGSLAHMLVTLCLLYILMRIPFWIARPVLSPFGSSPLRRAVRFAFTAAVLSRITPVLRGTVGAGRSRAAGTARRPRAAPGGGRGGTGRGGGPRPPRWVQPPLPGMPLPPRPPRYRQLTLFDMPRPAAQAPAPPLAPAPPPPRRSAGRRSWQPPLPGMPAPRRHRQLLLPLDPPPRRSPRRPPEGTR
jgi:hypothetical protein